MSFAHEIELCSTQKHAKEQTSANSQVVDNQPIATRRDPQNRRFALDCQGAGVVNH
jgi:hypothetical protein